MSQRGGGKVILLALVLGGLLAEATGCSRISEMGWLQTDRRMLETIARRSQALRDVEGKGVVRFEYQGQRVDVPFRVRLGPDALVQIDAEIALAALPGLGRLTVVSDDSGTQIYGSRDLRELARANVRPAALRALVLSLFGGGDLLVGWLGSTGCVIDRSTTCLGLEVSLGLDRERRAIERWEISDKTGKFGFSGLVYAWDSAGPLPRTVRGVIQPQGIVLTVRFDEVGLVHQGTPAGNFTMDAALH
jgi:hypothetical protein